uniref:Uncharacterized protein n=1 Tax=Panagrolaimus sp. ES5 TaxID=591445 RepID=A0AC34GZI1_9BILA
MLKISASARIKYSTGEIINLLSTDVERIRTFWFYMFDFVYTPIMISICLIGLSFTIGINVLYGISVLIAFFPINSILVKIATKCEERQMKLKDTRLKLMTDFLSGIKIIKFYAWEKSVQEHITNIRKKEVTQLKYAIICFSLMEISFNACPILATLASFVGYVIFQGHSLTPQVAFISLMLFSLMRFSVYRIPGLIQESVNAKISLKRIEKFLLEPETSEMINTMTPSNNDTIIQMKNANFTWNPDEEKTVLALKSLTFEIQKGELIGVIGRVGNGKSSFLSSICAELYQISGTFFRHPAVTVSLVSQEAWIQNLSLKNNILFGKPFEENLYQQTIYSCALKDDIKIFPAGDETEIGEKGLNLSGGQKARVALARAVYQNSDLYIFDDTLSAVDCHVGAHIFQEVIGNEGILKDKTRIFALNSIEILPKCDRIIVLKDGGIFDIGTFEELCFKKNTSFIDIIKELKTKDIEANETTNNKKLELKQKQEDNKNLKKSPALQKDFLEDPTSAQQPFANLIQDETSIESFRQIWMAKWTSNFRNETNSINDTQSLGIYGLFGILSCFVSGCSAVILAFGAVKASKKLHNNLLFSLLRSPMQFFDTTPLGRILNRLSKDIEKIDNDVPQKLNYSTILLAEGAFYIISAIYVIPEIGIASIIAIIAVIFVVRYYTYTSVQIRRLCSKAWSSVISHTQDSYVGINTLRAFGQMKQQAGY